MQKEEPEKSLEAVLQTLQASRRKRSSPDGPVYKAWGVAYFIAFLTTYVLSTQGGVGAFGSSSAVGAMIGLTWAVCMTGAGFFTYWHYMRHAATNGIDSAIGSRMGFLWPIAFALALVTAAGFNFSGLVMGVLFAFTVGVVYLAVGAMVLDNLMMALGVWLAGVNGLAFWLTGDLYPLVMAVLGGGGAFVAGVVHDRRAAVHKGE